jgi:uncharacterized protein (TIGR02996 family)
MATTAKMSSAGQALLAAVIDEPDDDLHRLAYADWCDENGDSDRAEFIRVQIELTRLPEDDPRRKGLKGAEDGLLSRHRREWEREVCTGLGYSEFRRGFVESLLMSARWFLRRAACVCRRTPLREASLCELGDGTISELAACPSLARLAGLELFGASGSDLLCTRVAPGEIEVLANSPHLACLDYLDLHDVQLGREGVRALAGGLWPSLARLTIARAGLRHGDVGVLCGGELLGHLRDLSLSDNDFGDAGAEAIAGCEQAAGLRHLRLFRCDLSDEGAVALARSAFLKGLRELDLCANNVSDRGARAFLDDRLDSLEWLCLQWNGVSPAVAQELRDRFGDRVQF